MTFHAAQNNVGQKCARSRDIKARRQQRHPTAKILTQFGKRTVRAGGSGMSHLARKRGRARAIDLPAACANCEEKRQLWKG